MKNLKKNEIETVSGGCEDTRSWCVPTMPFTLPEGEINPFPTEDREVYQDTYVAPEAPNGA